METMSDAKLTLKDGVLSVSIRELLDYMDKETLRRVLRYAIAQEDLFGAVLDCVADDSRFGYFFDGEWHFDVRRVLELREKLLPLMPTIARNAVLEALHQRNDAKADAERMHRWAWQLYHAWPRDFTRHRPEIPDWAPAPPPREDELPGKEET